MNSLSYVMFFIIVFGFFKFSLLQCSTTYQCEHCEVRRSVKDNEKYEKTEHCMRRSTSDENEIKTHQICIECFPGRVCDGSIMYECPEGTYRDGFGGCDGHAQYGCLDCPLGKFTSDTGNNVCGNCNAGCYCDSTGNIEGCPDSCTHGIGAYCPPGTEDADPACPSGYKCSSNTETATLCQTSSGEYCPGSTMDTPAPLCPAGNWCPTTTTSNACSLSGDYCPAGTSSSTHNCPPGSYCITSTQISSCTVLGDYCPSRTYSLTHRCPEGSYCLTSSQIAACNNNNGDYCPEGTYSASHKCTPGYYCTSSYVADRHSCSLNGDYCPEGTYSLTHDCPAGSVCTSSTSISSCSSGSYCPARTFNEQPCPAGGYCPTPASRTLCPDGTYNDQTGQISSSACTDCDADYYCIDGSTSATQNACDYSYWCPAGTGNPIVCNCAMHGYCTIDVDDCHCEQDYGGDNCEDFNCFGEIQTSGMACSQHGVCSSIDFCSCYPGYFGGECDYWFCNSVIYNDTNNVCSGHGSCESDDNCDCNGGFDGDYCELTVGGIGVVEIVLITGGVVSAVICVILFILLIIGVIAIYPISRLLSDRKKLKKFGDEISLLEMEEKEQKDDPNIAKFNINKKLMQIESSEMKLVKKLGSGAFAEVFLCSWSEKEVAMKLFQTRTLSGEGTSDFENFEKELAILSSISHPNILQFFGCSLRPPRVGIVIEYCSNGDLRTYLQRRKKLAMKKKYEILKGIISAMIYLHKRDIIHRDLKTENILLSSDEIPKVCDFGLSKIIEKKNSNMTRRTGTSHFMAPEVVLCAKYDNKCDVFSFAIIMHEVLTHIKDPYGKYASNVELKVANQPDFRPKIDEKKYSGIKFDWYITLMKRCWAHKANDRPSFEEINFEFGKHKSLQLPRESQFQRQSTSTTSKKAPPNRPKRGVPPKRPITGKGGPIKRPISRKRGPPKRPISARKRGPPKRPITGKGGKRGPPGRPITGKGGKYNPTLKRPMKHPPGRPKNGKNVPSWKKL